MSFAITSPIPIYGDRDGSPLVNGALYFGQPNQNPITSPITVYWDAALTQPASQPVRTVSGMPSRSGTPAILYAAGDHSVLVEDSRGSQIFYWRSAVEFALAAQLASTSNAAQGAGLVGYNPALVYAANTVGFALNARKAVFGTGVAATDDANIQAAIDAAPAMGVIDLFGTFASSAAKNLKPQLLIRNGDGAVINHSNAATNCFQYAPGGSLGFPGQIRLQGLRIEGPGAPGTGEPLGTLTWGNLKAAVFIDANSPFCAVLDCDIRGFFAGVALRNCYNSTVSGFYADHRHGIMIFGESHDFVALNPVCENCDLTGLSVNYGGGQLINQGACTVVGAYQNTQVGIWLEGCQGFMSAGTIYFEGNTMADIVNGVPDGGVYARSANFTRIQGTGCSSPVGTTLPPPFPAKAQGRNIWVSHSVDVLISGFGTYAGGGAPTTTPVAYVDGFCDRTKFEVSFLSSSNPYDFDDPTRVVIERQGTTNFTENRTNTLTFGPHGSSTPLGRGPYLTSAGTPSGRPSLVLEALENNTDVTLRAKAGQGLVRIIDSLGVEYFNADFVNGWMGLNRSFRVGQDTGFGQAAAIPTIASAATIAPRQLVSFVSGTTAIVNITVPALWPNGGRLTLIPTGAWTTTAAGNIIRAITAVANQPIDFIWDGTGSKWYPLQ